MVTINPEEVEKFNQIAQEWWDESGKFKPLHKFNPIRISYLKDKICQYFEIKEVKDGKPLKGLKILDVGCGGGLLCEPLARLGAKIVGIDAGEKNIGAAKAHALQENLEIDYRNQDVEELAATKEKFDIVLSMEVVEHVADVTAFIGACASCLKPENSLLFLATLNRTPQSFLAAIIGAEYVLRWLPRGTHDWKKFLKPSELAKMAQASGLDLKDVTGFDYNIFKDEWRSGQDLNVNYAMCLG